MVANMNGSILVLGSSGMMGWMLCEYLRASGILTYGLSRSRRFCHLNEYDILLNDNDIAAQIGFTIDTLRPAYIINCIGVVKQRSVLASEMVYTNGVIPHKLHECIANNGISLIHLSTDCVFSGEKGFYTTIDTPDATDLYGLSKRVGEVCGNGAITIRTSIIGPEYLPKKHGLLEWFRGSGPVVTGYRDVYFSGVTTLELSRFMVWLINSGLASCWQSSQSLLHFSGKRISKYELLSLINDNYMLNRQIIYGESPIGSIDRSLQMSDCVATQGYVVPDWVCQLENLKAWERKYESS